MSDSAQHAAAASERTWARLRRSPRRWAERLTEFGSSGGRSMATIQCCAALRIQTKARPEPGHDGWPAHRTCSIPFEGRRHCVSSQRDRWA
jgi:hypothetical protein